MTARALCVGINDYPIPGADLKGCVNDAQAWAGLLVDHFGFGSGDVRLLLDQDATKAAILAGLRDLLAGAQAGDVLVFSNSSHGSYVPDTSGDEDTYDETICPWDIRDNAIVDDDLREILADVPRGVHLTVISDSCHSGTVTRALLADNIPGFRTPDQRRVRFLNPALIRRGPILADPIRVRPRKRLAFPQSGMRHVLLTGCTDREYSYDARIGATFHGAMTYHAIKAIAAARYRLSYAELATRVGRLLVDAGYNQHPQLEGPAPAKRRQVFG